MNEACDVLVVGGGPGGAVCATRLAQKKRRVVVLEREGFPRFHLGESLLPKSMATLAEIGALDAARARYLEKRGATFYDDVGTRPPARFVFANAFKAERDWALQVPRDDFDELLLRHAAAAGADVRERWTVGAVRRDDAGRAIGVRATNDRGESVEIDARFVVDATGRDAMMARAVHAVDRLPGLDKTALYAHWDGIAREPGEAAGDIRIVLFGGGWFWVIPFADGRTSIGAVVSSAWMRARRADVPAGEDAAAHLHLRAIAESRTVAGLVAGAGAKQLWPGRATADFSFRVRTMWGDGWAAIGDAGGFIDPLFSTGAHLAMHGGLRAADAIDAILDDASSAGDRLAAWEREMRAGAETFLGAVQGFYEGPLAELLFVENPRTFVRRAITTMLAGDVFGDDTWLREVRTRFLARTSGE